MDVSQLVAILLSFIPEKYRPVAIASVEVVVLLQIVTSVVVSQLPVNVTNDPRYGKVLRYAHLFGHMRFRDEHGTLKLPGQALVPPALPSPPDDRQSRPPDPPADPKGQ